MELRVGLYIVFQMLLIPSSHAQHPPFWPGSPTLRPVFPCCPRVCSDNTCASGRSGGGGAPAFALPPAGAVVPPRPGSRHPTIPNTPWDVYMGWLTWGQRIGIDSMT